MHVLEYAWDAEAEHVKVQAGTAGPREEAILSVGSRTSKQLLCVLRFAQREVPRRDIEEEEEE